MVKFEKVYDPGKDEIISREEAIESDKVINPYFRCPVCQTEESTLGIFHRDGDSFFRLMPDGKHTDPECAYGVEKEKIRKMVKQQRNYLDVNEDSCIYELKKKMLANQNITATPSQSNIASANSRPSSVRSTSAEKTVTVARPHQFQLTQQNIAKVRSILESGELDHIRDKKDKKLPVCLYGEMILKTGSKNKYFHNYDVYDQQQNFLFSLGINVYNKELINEIESHLDQPVKFYGIFEFYTRNGFLDALTYKSDLFFI